MTIMIKVINNDNGDNGDDNCDGDDDHFAVGDTLACIIGHQ